MYISDLALTDFRSYRQAVASFQPGVTIFVGDNGQGKTNLVEAIGYLSTLGSHRVSGDLALIRQGASAALVQARVMHGDNPTTVEVEIYAGRANRARVNRGNVRPVQILGNVRTVIFAPEDLGLVKGDPGDRRAFLDSIMIQLRPRMASVRAEYEKVARQRAALLKAAGAARRRGSQIDLSSLDVWDLQMARLGAQITAARARIVSLLRPYVADFYRELSGNRGNARIDYMASASRGAFDLPDALAINDPVSGEKTRELIEAHENDLMDADLSEVRLISTLAERRNDEIVRGVNLVGPHRDELVLSLGTFPAKGYASHGESWSYALALKLAAWEVLRNDSSGEWAEDGEPILILDDVFAELDSRRRDRLAEIVSRAGQVFVTAAVGSELPQALTAQRFDVVLGSVSAHEGDKHDGDNHESDNHA